MEFAVSAPHGRRTLPLFAPPDSGSGARAEIKHRILLVEDDFLVALDLEHAFHQSGFVVVGVAATADEAITLAREHNPHLIVMDIRLLGIRDGVDAAIEIYQAMGIRSVFASAHKDERTVARAEAASPIGWIQKPYIPRDLVAYIETVLLD